MAEGRDNIIEIFIRAIDEASEVFSENASAMGLFKSAAVGLGVVIGGIKLKELAEEAFESAERINTLSQRVGVSVASLSRLEYAGKLTSVSLDELAEGTKRFQVLLSTAAAGGKQAQDVFNYLKIDFEDLAKVPLEEQLARISEQFVKIKNPADQTRVAVELFSRSGDRLIPFLKKGKEGIEEMTHEADQLGITMTTSASRGVERLEESLKKLKATSLGFARNLIGNIADTVIGPQTQLEELEARRDYLQKQFADPRKLPGPNAEKELRDVNALIVAQKRQAQLKEFYDSKNDELGPRKEFVDQQYFLRSINPQLEQAFEESSKFLDNMQKAREAVADTALHAQLEWEKFNEEIGKTGYTVAEQTELAKRKLDELLQEVNINDVKRLRLAEPLDDATKKVKEFVDILKNGLQNAAERGKFSFKELIRFILAELVKAELFKAIDNIGVALNKAFAVGAQSNAAGGGFWGTAIKAFAGFLGGRAGGGSFSGLTLVGESGPELVAGSGKVWNSQQLKSIMGSGGSPGLVYSPNTTINVDGSGGDPQQTAALLEVRIRQNNQQQMKEVQRMLERNGFGNMR